MKILSKANVELHFKTHYADLRKKTARTFAQKKSQGKNITCKAFLTSFSPFWVISIDGGAKGMKIPPKRTSNTKYSFV